MSNKNSEIKRIEYTCNGKTLTFNKPLVMAIVNLTPDSFYDGSKYGSTTDVLRDVEEKIKQGASIIDIGAASTRPGATIIDADEEWKRAGDALKQIRKTFPDIFISVDTYHALVAEKSADEGADIINDVSGGNIDEEMMAMAAKLNLPYILMHMLGTPATMQKDPQYSDIVKDIDGFFLKKIKAFKELGFEKLILDPGFGFGKNAEQNFVLLKNLDVFEKHGFPLLAGFSRKSMINRVIGTNPVTALNGTTVVNTIALMNGCNILRVHDVVEARQAIELVEFYKKQ
jgi:dihydropteroate synthase